MEVQFLPLFPVVGGFTQATCKYTTIAAGQTVSSVAWIHNGTLPPLTHGGRILIETDNDRGVSVCEIDSVEERDAGEYTCRVDFQNPPQQTNDTASLQVASEKYTVAVCCLCSNKIQTMFCIFLHSLYLGLMNVCHAMHFHCW